ncbi:MAG TPA: CHASE2 domain-containing protein [Candidatus Acidoferrum sp.]|nr:CHASE2 domain-containing protein [Candidatus Acidoferrum sp.]
MRRPDWKRTASYVTLLSGAYLIALLFSWFFGTGLDDYTYDLMFNAYRAPAWQPEVVVLAIDEPTLQGYGGFRNIRTPLAEGLRIVARAKPKVVAVDVILADSSDPAHDRPLAEALRATPNLVLSSELVDEDRVWEDPRPEFAGTAQLGHVHAQPDKDGITRSILLEQRVAAGVPIQNPRDLHRWAFALEAYRLGRKVPIVENPVLSGGLAKKTLLVGDTAIPVQLRYDKVGGDPKRLMRVRYFPPGMTVPRVSLKRLIDDPSLASRLTGKAVFIGLTAQNIDIRDRLFTPLSNTPGIEINAAAYETIARASFITDLGFHWVIPISMALMVAIGLAFRYLPGWWAYGAGGGLLMVAMVIPYVFFTHQRVFPFSVSALVAWLGTLTAASYYHLVVRRNLRIEQSSRERYQQAMHFVTHEMRTPLSAIQGSSELISRYAMTEDKRKQIAELINSESKRLARMVEIFLNVERLSAGQMGLKQEPIQVKEMMEVCMTRVRPLADRKHIAASLREVPDDILLSGDRELMEYACYNLLTNAIKYSPQRTEVTVSVWKDDARIRIAVQDQGIGMDQKEVKQIFQKFYRTKKAEESGEAGTGIGLSIVHQIVEQHGGRIEVTSQPGAGSCFTLVMPARMAAAVPTSAKQN